MTAPIPIEHLLAARDELRQRVTEAQAQRLLFALYPEQDTTWNAASNRHFMRGAHIYARDKYQKHLEFFRAGRDYRERCFMAANRTSKTLGGGGYELACHLTGEYPPWWEGRVFDHPVNAWAAGKTNETTRDIIQQTMLGEVVHAGTPRKAVDGRGLVPGYLLGKPTWKQGVADLVDTIKIRHKSGEDSLLGFKAYNQGRGSFEGTAQHVIWCDEEPPMDVYGECLVRTMTTRGIIMITFTPLEGLSKVCLQFLPKEFRGDVLG